MSEHVFITDPGCTSVPGDTLKVRRLDGSTAYAQVTARTTGPDRLVRLTLDVPGGIDRAPQQNTPDSPLTRARAQRGLTT